MPRKEKKFHFIYKTTNLLNSKYYIGMHSTDNLEDGYLGSGKRLRYSINKHGKENHEREILEFVDNRDELKKREEEVVNLDEIAKKDCMNLIVGGGESGFDIINENGLNNKSNQCYLGGKAFANKLKNDEEFKKVHIDRVSKYLKKYLDFGVHNHNTFEGRKHTEETKKLMSEINKGKRIGNENSQYGTCWITRDGENKKIKKEELEMFVKEGWEKGRK